MPIGAHVSIAGGLERAFERAHALGCEAFQVFTKNASQWRSPPLSGEGTARWRAAWAQTPDVRVVAHDSYLVNLASPDDALWAKSIDAFVDEIERCEALEIPGLVAHPGSPISAGVEYGLARVARALDEVHRRTRGFRVRTLLETTAGTGATLGARFEELAAIRERVAAPERTAVCLDTCHVYAAGYPLATRRDFDALLAGFDRVVGLANLAAIHLNDSKFPLGSRKDRHAHIGAGRIGPEPFGWFVRSRRLAHVPMVIETEPEGHAADLETLRRLRRGG